MSDRKCRHCHTLFQPTPQEAEFCCGGCRFVNKLILGEGLDDFYRLQDGQMGRPIGERPFEDPHLDWLERLIESKSNETSQSSLKLRISGVSCVGCVWLIEKLFMAQQGAVRANIFPATAEAEFIWETGSGALIELAKELPRYGYVLEDPSVGGLQPAESKKIIPRLGLSAAFAMNTMAFALPRYLGMDDSFAYARIFDLIALLSSTLALLVGGSYFFVRALAALRHRSIHIDLPIALGLGFAYAGSIIGWLSGNSELIYFDFVATFTVLMLGGRYLHLTASERAQSQLQGQSAIPREITLADGSQKRTEGIALGDHLQIQPGQALPVASRLLNGPQEFSLAWMTGEPLPVTYETGSAIPSGAIPLGVGLISLEAEEDFEDSLVSRLTREETEQRGSETIQRILKVYLSTIIVIGFGSLGLEISRGHPFLEALQTMISIFVVSCPCAIGVAIPLVDRRAASAMARMGVFIQNPGIWHFLTKIRHLIFDKTGTLTLETPELTSLDQLDTLGSEARKALGILTSGSLHPLSRALNRHLQFSHSDLLRSEAALGVRATLDGVEWTLGKPGWCGKSHFRTEITGELSCELARNGSPVACFTFRESLRPRTRNTLAQLNDHFDLHILSGDQEHRVQEMAASLGIPSSNAHGGVDPSGKQSLVSGLTPCLYLGDGMNDTLAFSSSTISGTPVADRSLLDRRSDFLFTCSGLTFLPGLFSLAKWRHHTVILVLSFTILYNLGAIGACLSGHMTPFLAAILMPLSSIFSLLIARRAIPNQNPGDSAYSLVPGPQPLEA